MMHSGLRPVLVFSLFCLLIGCSPLSEIGSQQAANASFARRSTFKFLPDKSVGSLAGYWRAYLWQDILSVLNAKGYRFFPARQTDLLVAYHIVLQDNETLGDLDPNLAPGQAAIVDQAKLQDPKRPGAPAKGSIVIDFIDPKSKSLLWRGWARTTLDQVQPGPSMQKLSKLAVNQILAKLPSRR
jgi:Domain of unknown function (DUF4136)